jgi:surface antigen
MKRLILWLPLLWSVAAPLAIADPPDHAPAYGQRHRHERHHERDHDDRAGERVRYRGYTGVEYAHDHGVLAGRCNTDVVLAAVGAAGGAYVGNRMGTPENRVLTTVVGAVVGGVLGRAVGDALDDRDRACMGHALEMAPVGRPVRWQNPRSRVVYVMTPVRDLRAGCREFELAAEGRAARRGDRVMACRDRRGAWVIQG